MDERGILPHYDSDVGIEGDEGYDDDMEFEDYDEDWVEEEDAAEGREPGKLAGEEVTDSAAVLEIGESYDEAGEEEDA